MREQKVKVILHESWYPPDVTSRVAKETGAKMVVVSQSPGALKGTEDYIAHLDHLVSAIARPPSSRRALTPSACTPGPPT